MFFDGRDYGVFNRSPLALSLLPLSKARTIDAWMSSDFIHSPAFSQAPKAGSCLNMRKCHPHVEDDTAQNHYELLVCVYRMLRIRMNYYGFWT
jgi:hypothetical protein